MVFIGKANSFCSFSDGVMQFRRSKPPVVSRPFINSLLRGFDIVPLADEKVVETLSYAVVGWEALP